MKNAVYYFVMVAVVIGLITPVLAEQKPIAVVDYKIIIDGETKKIKNSIVSIDDWTYLPLREIAESLNLYVVWDEENKLIKISDIGIIYETDSPVFSLPEVMTADVVDYRVKVNGYVRQLSNQIYLINERTYLPLREISEILNFQVDWDENNRSVIINTPLQKEEQKEFLPFIKDNLYGYMDELGNVVISPKYAYAFEFSEGLAAVADANELFGYIDVEGNLVIPHRYRMAQRFSEGLAVVDIGNEEFETTKEYEANYNYGEDYEEMLWLPHNGNYKYIDKEGHFVFEDAFLLAEDFQGSLALVGAEEKGQLMYSYIDKQGKSKATFKENVGKMSSFKNGVAIIQHGKDYKVINQDCDTVLEVKGYNSFVLNDNFITAQKDNRYGVLDLEGNIIIDFKYGYLSEYSDGLFVFNNYDEGGRMSETEKRYGYLDIHENIIIEPIFKSADPFLVGKAAVLVEQNAKYLTWSFINKKGKFVSANFQGEALFPTPNGRLMLFREGRGRYINSQGEIVEPKFENTQ